MTSQPSTPSARPDRGSALGLILAVVAPMCAVGAAERPASPPDLRRLLGEPWRRHTIDNSSRGADGVRLADVNADGHPDIATGWEEGGTVRVYINPGPARASEAWETVTVGRVGSPEDAVLVDLDGDGALDAVSSCEGRTRTVFVHWAPNGARRFTEAGGWHTEAFPETAGRQMWMFALPMQIDGDAGLDLVVGSRGRNGSISWLQAPNDPRAVAAWKLHRLRDAGWIMSLISRDMDADGDLDIVASDRKGPQRGVFWLENPGAAAARAGRAWQEHFLGAADAEVMFIDVTDFNRDGRWDVVAAVKPRQVMLLEHPGQPAAPFRQRTIELPVTIGSAKAVRVADIDLDGKLDVVFSCEEAAGDRPGVVWFHLEGFAGTLVEELHDISGPAGTKFDLVELVDLDGDGDLDAVTTEETDGLGVVWYENPTRPPK